MGVWRTDKNGLTNSVFLQSFTDGKDYPNLLPLSGATALNNYSLDCNAGAYTLTVGAVTFDVTRTIDAGAGSYTLTVGDATLQKGFTLTADAGSYALTVGAVTFDVARTITAASGSYALTVGAASLEKGFTLAADAGSYSLSVGAVTFDVARTITADAGAYALTVGDASLEYSGGDKSIAADAGSYTVSGADANLIYSGAGASTAPTPAGRSKTRKKRRYLVEIDGQDFPVDSPEEARVLLQAAKEALAEQIEQPVKKAKNGKLPVNKPRIRVTGLPGPELTEIVQAISGIRDEIGQMYRDAARTAEIAYLIGQKRKKDDEEALLLLI